MLKANKLTFYVGKLTCHWLGMSTTVPATNLSLCPLLSTAGLLREGVLLSICLSVCVWIGFAMNVVALLPYLVEHYDEPSSTCIDAAVSIAQVSLTLSVFSLADLLINLLYHSYSLAFIDTVQVLYGPGSV